jgi:endonuclease/exonuclease/phosphatase (EEP) superfamily protein YafD
VKADVGLYPPLLDLIKRTRPDLVFLHEATPGWEERMFTAGLDYQVVSSRNTGVRFGTLVLAPLDAEVEGFGFAEGEPRAVQVDIATPNGDVSVLGIHPLSPTDERRSALRDAQLDYAAEWAAGTPGRIVIVGDFNATPWSHAFRAVEGATDLMNSQRGFGVQATFPANLNPVFRVPIDHLLHSNGLETVDRRLGPSLGSDHYPLLVELALTR